MNTRRLELQSRLAHLQEKLGQIEAVLEGNPTASIRKQANTDLEHTLQQIDLVQRELDSL